MNAMIRRTRGWENWRNTEKRYSECRIILRSICAKTLPLQICRRYPCFHRGILTGCLPSGRIWRLRIISGGFVLCYIPTTFQPNLKQDGKEAIPFWHDLWIFYVVYDWTLKSARQNRLETLMPLAYQVLHRLSAFRSRLRCSDQLHVEWSAPESQWRFACAFQNSDPGTPPQ